MQSNKANPKIEISYYGKKTYYLNEDLARKVQPEQTSMNFMYEDIEDEKSSGVH